MVELDDVAEDAATPRRAMAVRRRKFDIVREDEGAA
jgi:hypothetical protein